MTTASNGLRDRSTGQLVKDLSRQASTLIRQEIELAKAETTEKAKQSGIGVGALGAAAVAAMLALGTLTAFLILVLDEAMPGWAAALCVTVLWSAVGAALALYGRQKLREAGAPIPEKTIDTLKEDIEWLRHPTS